MHPLDILKGIAVALLLMVINVGVAFAVVWAYSAFIAPGHDEAFYQAAAERIAPWSSIVAGIPLFFGTAWLLAKRQPQRNGLIFAATIAGAYTIVDLSILAAVGALSAQASIAALSMVTKFAGAVLGAKLAA